MHGWHYFTVRGVHVSLVYRMSVSLIHTMCVSLVHRMHTSLVLGGPTCKHFHTCERNLERRARNEE